MAGMQSLSEQLKHKMSQAKQDVGCYMLVHTDLLSISYCQVWWNRIREAYDILFARLKSVTLNLWNSHKTWPEETWENNKSDFIKLRCFPDEVRKTLQEQSYRSLNRGSFLTKCFKHTFMKIISPKEMQILTNDMCLNRKKLQQQQNLRCLVRPIVAATIRH